MKSNPVKKSKSVKKLTTSELLVLIVDIAYQQATREVSGSQWFDGFIKDIDNMQANLPSKSVRRKK